MHGSFYGNIRLTESLLDETQCGFRKQRGTIDMIFTARQLQEKAREQQCQLYMCFKKAYESVPRDALWLLLGRWGFPPKLINILKNMHSGMNAVRVNGILSDPFRVSNGLKQGCVLAPFLFNFYFIKVMQDALDGFNDGFQVKYKLDGKRFWRSGTKLPMSVNICDLRFADDVMASCHNDDALQAFINHFTHAAQSWGLSVSTEKTKVMVQLPPNISASSTNLFYIENSVIESVASFKYLGSTLSSDVSLTNEMNNRIAKAAGLFSHLKNKVS